MACLEWSDGTRYELADDTVTIGRDRSNDLVLAYDAKVSRAHAEMQFRDERWLLLDLGSRNGTTINGRRVRQHPLKDGDRLQIGDVTFVFVAHEDPNDTETSEVVIGERLPLSPRERQVIALVAEGLTDRQIGERLFISTSTVRSHLDRIAEKTGSRRRVELTRLASELELRG